MESIIKTLWKKKIIRLLEVSYAKLPHQNYVESLAMEAACLAEASTAFLFSKIESQSTHIETALDPNIIGKSISQDLFIPYYDAHSIAFKKSTKNSAGIFSAPHILSIPLKLRDSDKILMMGFKKSPKSKAGLIQYAETVQSLILALDLNESNIPIDLNPDHIINSEQRANYLIQNLQELFCSINEQYKITCISPFLQNIIYEGAGIMLNQGSDFPITTFSKLCLNDIDKLIKKVFTGEQINNLSQMASNGIHASYEFNIIPIKNCKEEIIEVAIIGKTLSLSENFQSISNQKNLVLKGILSYLPVIIYRIDAEGNFLELTGSGLRKLNIQNNEMVGKTVLKIFPDLKKFIPTITTGVCQRLVIKGAIDSAPRVFKNYTFPDQNTEGGIVGFAIDVTEQDYNEQQLKKSKEIAEKASLAKSHFLANQSHEIRTPINAILGFAQLMKNNLHTSESEEYIDYILSSGQILLNLIGNVLDLTKIEEGKLDLVEEPFYIQEVITSNLYPYKFQAKEKGLDFIMDFDPDLPKYIIGDAGKIVQIIINLLGNSLKFTKEGYIKIQIKSLSPAIEGEKTNIQIAVSDTGIGIPVDKQQTIFESFTQADATINRKYGGSGLGLSIVKALTDLMNGNLKVNSPNRTIGSKNNPGTTIYINLPLKVAFPPSVEIHEEAETNINYNGQLKILLVDDNYLNLRLASTMLNNLGCKVTITNNGREAIKELVQNNFDLVFMDVQMPVLDGYETTKLIRDKMKLDIPIIGLSANVYKEDIDLCYESGMDDYLSRPYTIKSFHEKVFKWAPSNQNNQYDKVNDSLEEPHSRLTKLTFLEQVFNGDKEKVVETVKDFMIHNEKMINTLGEAIQGKDFLKIASIAHNIRSSLQTVGLDCLYEVLTDIELISKGNKNLKLLEKYYIGVKEISQRANVELEESLVIRQR